MGAADCVAGLAIFSVASLLCALAPDPTFLNLARAFQGVGGAVMFAVSLALIAQEFTAGRERGTAMGLYGATIGVAVAIGPLVGGALTDSLGVGVGLLSQRPGRPQEAFLRLHREVEAGARINSPEAYLITVVTRLAIDELRSARARRETYVGEWLPEPILTAEDADPARHAEIAESLSVGLLRLLETLSPEVSAVFLLREVFEYPHARIAEILGKSDAAVRQLAVKARRRVEGGEPRFETSREQRDRLASRFFDAFEEGNLEALEGLLASDATLHGDGGGKVPALARAVQG
ncbi:MAG: MFS transporter, partial [Solirubrobacterales bacterium]